MGKEVAAKVNAPLLLEKELLRRSKRKEYGIIALASATEAWMPSEEKYRLTRKCLEIIARFRFPVHCSTKSTLILRDFDLLSEIDKNAILPKDLQGKLKHGALITVSLSTLEGNIAKIFEPNAPKPKERLDVIQKAKEEGLYTGIAYIPVLPFISDSNEQLDEMIKTAKEYGADYVFVGALTLYGIGKKLYYNILEKHFPELVSKYRKLYRIFNQPSVKYQSTLEKRTRELCKKYKVKYRILSE